MIAKSIHVVSKLDNAKHAVFHIGQDPPSLLAASSVRVQTWLISFTYKNLTYARSGTPLHWWDTYPVPEASPNPFSNREKWGVVPAWGYGCVLESTIDAIVAPGSLLWDMWPTSEHAVDLQLEAIQPSGHWSERSAQRSKLMTVYNSYEQVGESDAQTMRMTALCKPLWQGPYLLNTSVFSARRIHPFGFGAPWSQEDADLSSAVVVSLSASSKTGRSFGGEMTRNRDLSKGGPRALIQMTSVPNTLPEYDSSLPVRAAAYDDTSAMAWAEQFKPSQVVIVDFGASDAVLGSVRAAASKLDPNVTVIAVGYEAKVYIQEEIAARMATANTKVPVNTSEMRDPVIESQGGLEFFQQLDSAWDKCLKEEAFSNLQVKVLNSVQGEQGIERAWSALCDCRIPADVGMVVDLSKR